MSITLRKVLITAIALLAVGGLVAACGDEGEEGTKPKEEGGGGTTVNITATDGTKYEFVLDKTSVPAGEITFVLSNKGKLEHELLVYPQQDISAPLKEKVAAVKAGQTLSISSRIQGLVNDAAGEHELEVEPGESGKFTVKLTPGTYELGCIVVETIGAETVDHHAKGMHATLTVK